MPLLRLRKPLQDPDELDLLEDFPPPPKEYRDAGTQTEPPKKKRRLGFLAEQMAKRKEKERKHQEKIKRRRLKRKAEREKNPVRVKAAMAKQKSESKKRILERQLLAFVPPSPLTPPS